MHTVNIAPNSCFIQTGAATLLWLDAFCTLHLLHCLSLCDIMCLSVWSLLNKQINERFSGCACLMNPFQYLIHSISTLISPFPYGRILHSPFFHSFTCVFPFICHSV